MTEKSRYAIMAFVIVTRTILLPINLLVRYHKIYSYVYRSNKVSHREDNRGNTLYLAPIRYELGNIN